MANFGLSRSIFSRQVLWLPVRHRPAVRLSLPHQHGSYLDGHHSSLASETTTEGKFSVRLLYLFALHRTEDHSFIRENAGSTAIRPLCSSCQPCVSSDGAPSFTPHQVRRRCCCCCHSESTTECRGSANCGSTRIIYSIEPHQLHRQRNRRFQCQHYVTFVQFQQSA